MKKQAKLLLLALLLAALVAVYVLATRESGAKQVAEEETDTPLCGFTVEDMTALSWTNGDGSFRFEKKDDIWMNAEDERFPVDQSVLGTLAGRIANLTATRKLEGASSPADYGLDEPALTVTAEGPEGAVTYAMGDATPFADGYYVSVSGDEAIYTIATSLANTFDKSATDLAALESIPQVEDVSRLSVGEFAAERDEAGVWRDAATGERLDGDAVQALADGANDLSWSALVEVGADDAALETYGLGDSAARVTLTGEGGAERALLLGAENDDGDRYARLPDSAMVYTVYGSDVSELLEASAGTLYEKAPVRLATDELAKARFAWDGGELTLVREVAEATADEAEADEDAEAAEPEGTAEADDAESTAEADDAESTAEADDADDADEAEAEAPEASYAVNGAQADAEAAEALWEALTALEATARAEETPEGEPVLSVTFAGADGEEQTVSFYPRDVDSYLSPVTDTHALLVPADGVDKLVRMLKQF